jgi:hypothetical protein
MPIDNPTPLMGPISGEMSMAPIITAVELTLSPTEQMITAKNKIQTLAPLNSTSFFMEAMVDSIFVSSCKLVSVFKSDIIF